MFDNLLLGLSVALTFENIAYCFGGALIGTLIGMLPGLGPAATVALLIPLTFALSPVSAFILLGGIYYGAQYGGSTTAILLRLPGETSSVVTALDGHEMAKRGMAGKALATAALSSFFAGTVSVFIVALFAAPLTAFALQFASPEFFSVMVLGLVAAVALASGSILRSFAMLIFGIAISLSGQDVFFGEFRLTFGLRELYSGFEFVAVTMGIFGISEVINNLRDGSKRDLVTNKVSGLWLGLADLKAILMPAIRGTGIGALLGILPGGGAAVASFASYSIEKNVSRHPETFGKGAIEAVAGPEGANNAAAQTSFIPMLTLGIPANPVMALMIAVLIIQGITPGPQVMTRQPELVWGLIASMWIGNVILLILNLPLIGLWIKLLRVPNEILFPIIVVVCIIGAFNISSSPFDVMMLALFGLLGYVLLKLDCEPAPFLLGFVLGPMLEDHFRRSLLVSRGDYTVFFTRPISATLLALALIALIASLLPILRKAREQATVEG